MATKSSYPEVGGVSPVTRRQRPSWMKVLPFVALAFVTLAAMGGSPIGSIAAAAPRAVQVPPPSGDSGTTVDPLQYNCGDDAPSCGQVGESNGYYNGSN